MKYLERILNKREQFKKKNSAIAILNKTLYIYIYIYIYIYNTSLYCLRTKDNHSEALSVIYAVPRATQGMVSTLCKRGLEADQKVSIRK